jgi:8-oxo-dGTP diphosphatase
MEKIVRVGVGVCVVKDGKVLLGRRGSDSSHGRGSWAFPGGKLDFGEDWATCAARETLEEAGISITHVRFITCTNDYFKTEGKHFITIYMRADWQAGEPQSLEPGKIEDWQWFAWDDLPSSQFLPLQHLVESGFRP